jgi:hypothetical protein
MGVLSIVGMGKKYAFTTLSLIKCRMFGFTSTTELKKALGLKKNQKLKELYEHYTSRRHIDQLRNDLMRSGLIKVWMGYGKGTIIATAHTWDDIKLELVEQLRKKQGKSLQITNKRQRDELTQLLK